jgi:oligosaccharide reducing-end xylanase
MTVKSIKIRNNSSKSLLVLIYITILFFGNQSVIHSQNIKQPPKIGAFQSGNYRNLFVERGLSNSDVKTRLDSIWQQLFYGNDTTQRVYYPADSGMAYIFDIASKDIRSEGMSYGMMISLQMDKKKEFDAIWKWALKYMYNNEGKYKGYFAWHCKPDGSKIDFGPASDGEEWFVTALFMASGRWGDGEGIYNYKSWAQIILKDMIHHPCADSVTPMFDPFHKQIVFVPEGRYAGFTDPSYHLPAFYALWSMWSKDDAKFLSELADTSRKFFRRVVHPDSRLSPDYANFNGIYDTGFCCNNIHTNFLFDAWRTIGNIATDYAWFAADPWQMEQCDRLQAFFLRKGISTYPGLYKVDGTSFESDHSTGLIAMNAMASLAACNSSRAAMFVDELWKAGIPSGHYRYYDGLLYFIGMLHVSGNFRAYSPK